MNVDRRSFIKTAAASSAIATASSLFPGISFGNWTVPESASGTLTWKKSPCRFCGTGCGVLIGVSSPSGRAVAVKGDPNCSVNKGLCCVKGYHSVQALYGDDRITTAKVRRNGKMVEVPIKEALDIVAAKIQETIKTHGKDSVAMYVQGNGPFPTGTLPQSCSKAVSVPIMSKLTPVYAWPVP